jgi:hypothetical protein
MPGYNVPPKPVASKTAANVRLKTVRDIATEDQVSEKTVYRAIAAGHLEVLRVGPGKRLIRIHPDAHAAYRRAFHW